MASKRVSKKASILDSIFNLFLKLFLSKIDKKSFNMGSEIEAFFGTRFEAFLKAPGRLLASILEAFWA